MASVTDIPGSADEMRKAIIERYDSLSQRLQQIARYVLDAPDEIALETLTILSERSGVQPSAIVRFAQAFGFEGASQMQRLFRDELVAGSGSYGERVRNASQDKGTGQKLEPGDLLHEFIDGNLHAVRDLAQSISAEDFARALALIIAADTVYVAGFRRSFPVAAYLAYSLIQGDKRVILADGIAGLIRQQVHGITPRDLLIIITYPPYADEVAIVVNEAMDRGAKILAITDSPVSPTTKSADLVLPVKEAEVRSFRSLSASMCLAQALSISFAFAANADRAS